MTSTTSLNSLINAGPIPIRLRSLFEDVFRADLASVRIHRSWLPSTFGARGLACGDRIYVPPGLSLFGRAGVRLLLHELVHVLQQRAGRVNGAPFTLVNDPGLESEAVRAERFAEPVWAALRGGSRRALRGAAAVPGRDCAAPGLPVIQPSQGTEIEITPIKIGFLDRAAHNGAGRVRTAREANKKWEIPYNSKLYTSMAVTDVPELYVTSDRGGNHAIFEVVTGPVMTQKVAKTQEYIQLTTEVMSLIHFLDKKVRGATAPWLPIRDLFLEFNRTVGKAAKCRPLVPTKYCLSHDIAIDVKESQAELGRYNEMFVNFFGKGSEPWAQAVADPNKQYRFKFDGITVYTQHTGSIPIERLHLEESRDRLIELIWGDRRIDLLKRSFRAGNALVDQVFVPLSGRVEGTDHRILRKLRGLMILTMYILHMGLASKDEIRSKESPKNRFDLLPRNCLRDVVRAALSLNARTLLYRVMTDAGEKTKLYAFIAHYLGVSFPPRTFTLVEQLEFEDHQPTVRDFLDYAFAPDPTELANNQYTTTQVAKSDKATAQRSAVAEPFPLSPNWDDPPQWKAENIGVIRNLLFEARSSVTGTSHTFEELVRVRRMELTKIWDLLAG